MKITAQDLLRFKVIDGIVREPLGGAHRGPEAVIAAAGEVIAKALGELGSLSPDELRKARYDKFLAIGRSL
jgi:acetyl-CoA carboxylase carboxyl transferase subunit alpha